MTRYHRLFTSFWRSPKVRAWPDHQKLLGAYLLTCPHRSTEGLFWLPLGYVSQDLGWSIERVSEGYSGLETAGFCRYDTPSETVLLLKALKYEAPAGEKQIQGAINRLADVPPSPLFALLRDAAAQYAPEFAKALDAAFPPFPPDTVSEGYPYPSDSSSSSSSSSSNSTSSSNLGRSPETPSTSSPATLVVVSDPDPLEPQETAQTVLGAYIDWRVEQGITGIDARTKGQLAKHLGQAFDGGHPAEAIKQGLHNWHLGEQHPATLPSYIDAAARGGRSRPVTRQERGRAQLLETDRVLDAWAAADEGRDDGQGAVEGTSRPAQRQLPR